MNSTRRRQQLDAVNRPVWSDHVGEFVTADSWTDRGERNVLNELAPRLRGRRLLDVGVGAGRTAWLLPLLSDDYIAIDYTPEMVAAARRNHPERDIREGDARDLSGFDDGRFDFVMFSYNGLDALEHDDRVRALAEFHRVLAPGGILMYSTLDMTGRDFVTTPWNRRDRSGRRSALRRGLAFVSHLPFNIPRYRREGANWRRLRAQSEDHGDWALRPLAAHEFGLLVHYTTPEAARREVEALGFVVESLTDDAGRRVRDSAAPSDGGFFHVVATKA